MTKISKEKANSGGKAAVKVSKTSKLAPPKKVRTNYAAKQANEDDSEQPSGSGQTFVSTQVPDEQLCCFNMPVKDDFWSLSMLANMCSIHRGRAVRSMQSMKKRYGNALYLQWDDEMVWSPAGRFDSTYSVSKRKVLTWELVFYRLYSESEQQWPVVEKSIRDALDISHRGNENYDSEENWYLVVQSLVMGIVAADPLQFFDYASPSYRGKSYSRFWDKSNPSNPRLLVDSRPLAKFWILCCEVLGHPWVDPNTTDVPLTLDELRQSMEQPLSADRKRDRSAEVHDTDEDDSQQSTSARVNPNSPGRGSAFQEPPLKPVAESPGAGLDSIPEAEELEGDSFSSDLAALGDEKPAVTPTTREDSSQSHASGQASTDTSNTSVPMGQITVTATAKKDVSFETPPRKKPGTSGARPTSRQLFLSEAQQTRIITQIRMDSIPRTHSKFFCLSVGWHWEGDEAEEGTVQDKGAATIVSRLVTMMEILPADFMLLPVGEYQYQHSKYWVTDKKQVEALTSFTKLRMYLDLSWQNGHTISRASQGEGPRVLRSRIRTAFNSAPETVESLLNDLFAETGFNMGIFPSPLEVGNALRIGWLLNYPLGINLEWVARELMRIFDFHIPIALEAAWPLNPSFQGKTFKRGGRQALHVFTPSNRAAEVVQKLSAVLSRDTPKHDMPFGSDTRFVYDWKAVRARKIGVDGDPEITDMIVQMINTHENFGATTCVIRPSFPIHMLEQTYIELFGEDMTLLRLLFSVLCTPAQASKASELKDVDCGDPNTGSDAHMSEGAPSADPTAAAQDEHMAGTADSPAPAPATNTATTSSDSTSDPSAGPPEEQQTPASAEPSQDIVSPPRNQNRSPSFPVDTTSQPVSTLTGSPAPSNPIIVQSAATPEESEDEKRARLIMKDIANRTPAPLFLLILPSKNGGLWIFVVREKFRVIAENVLKGLAAFLTYHLELHSDVDYMRTTLKRWICKKHCRRTWDYSMVWDPATFQVQSELDKNANLDVDERDDWLSKFDEDKAVNEAFEGTLSINLEMSSTRLMDDGSTVASRLREMLRLRQVDTAYHEAVEELEQKDQTIDDQNAKIAALQAQLEAQNSKPTPTPEQHNESNAQADARGGSSGADS